MVEAEKSKQTYGELKSLTWKAFHKGVFKIFNDAEKDIFLNMVPFGRMNRMKNVSVDDTCEFTNNDTGVTVSFYIRSNIVCASFSKNKVSLLPEASEVDGLLDGIIHSTKTLAGIHMAWVLDRHHASQSSH